MLLPNITGIDAIVLNDADYGLGQFCVSKGMSWAAGRKSPRVEDMAYCLLGICDVNMPLLYGKGERAVSRLQQEIIKNSNDDSILAWGLDDETRNPMGSMSHKVIG